MKINLGCGNEYKEGYINCDISKNVKADKYFDIKKGLPFEDNSVEEVYCGCVLEQICDPKDFLKVMNEIWRVLIPGGKLKGYVPNANHICAFQDPMDCRFFTEETWRYFEKGHPQYENFGKIYGFKPWRNIWYATNDYGIMYFEMCSCKD